MCGKVDVGGRGVTKIIVFKVFNNKDNVITFMMIALRKFLIRFQHLYESFKSEKHIFYFLIYINQVSK